jgi:3-hydroxybutyryl-CoA dehydratase
VSTDNTVEPGRGRLLPPCEISISQASIDAYAQLSGDFNSVHVDPQAGAVAGFGGTIAHGCIPLEPVFQSIRTWLGTDTLPPDTTLRLRYRAPSRPGDVIRSDARIAAERTIDGRTWFTISFSCTNRQGTLVIDGECEIAP